ncbi:molybdopterin molybdotransferase MoeA [Leptolyngbya sp. AN02str]|uniref:molybdopterin molybdotransferase MoeA n=1 Tax=Leptolyngbya sp. AN02str TaxID=3423363 RepID=UPI003D31E0D6
MIQPDKAERIILDLVCPPGELDAEWVNLRTASDRVLARPIVSPLDFPHWDNSAMDGYAVRAEDVAMCSETQPIELQIIEEIPAGVPPQQTVQAGQAARILTGSMMPSGADTVVMQEVTRREGDRVFVLSAPQPRQFVRRRGEFHQAGDELLSMGTLLGASEVAVLAAAQCASVQVFRRVRVAILSTGNELVEPEQPLQSGQIVDSNQYALAAAVMQLGAVPLCMGIVRDDPDALAMAIAHARTTADIVLSSGGVSVGDYDYVEPVLESLGGTIHIRSVAIKPGKPLTVATFDAQTPQPSPAQPESNTSCLYFGLPGNPVSALVTFWRFVQPAIRKRSGLSHGWHPTRVIGRSRQDLRSDGKRESCIWGKLQLTPDGYWFDPAGGSHSSGNLINLAQTNALAIIPIGQTHLPSGQSVQLMPIHTVPFVQP